MRNIMITEANDVIGDGKLHVFYNPSALKPLSIEFKRELDEEFDSVEMSISMSRASAKKIALYILENL